MLCMCWRLVSAASQGSPLTSHAGCHQPSAEAWQELLRGLVFSRWRAQGCEGYEDTLKMTSLVNFWLPYLPLGGSALRQLMERGLEARRSSLAAAKRLELAWDPGVVDWLLSKVGVQGQGQGRAWAQLGLPLGLVFYS